MPYDTFIGFTLLQSLQEHNNHHVSDKTTVRTLWSITVFLQLNTCHGTQNIFSVSDAELMGGRHYCEGGIYLFKGSV